MGEIHGIVYIIIGVFFAITSKLIDTNKQENKLAFFVVVGGILFLIGVGKIIAKWIKESKPKPGQAVKKYCRRCGTIMHSFQEFCHRCGTKIFK